ncbi:MAG: hypothetical protein ACLUPX_03715 [Atopobiaceae bacterium]
MSASTCSPYSWNARQWTSCFFETERDGFYDTYYENPREADCAMIGLFGDDQNDYMAKCGAKWLLARGNIKVSIMGMSTAGMETLVAATCFPDITLTFGLTDSDFVWQGFEQGKKDGCRE